MSLSDTERKIILGVIDSLKGRPSTSPEVVEALQGPARLFLSTYVIGPLEIMVSDERQACRHHDMKTALYMSLYNRDRKA